MCYLVVSIPDLCLLITFTTQNRFDGECLYWHIGNLFFILMEGVNMRHILKYIVYITEKVSDQRYDL